MSFPSLSTDLKLSCLSLDCDDSDDSDIGGSPCKSVRSGGFRANNRKKQFLSSSYDFNEGRLARPPPIPLFGNRRNSNSIYPPMSETVLSPAESVQSLTNSVSEMSELESDYLAEESEEVEEDGFEFTSRPTRSRLASNRFFHRPNRSVLGITDFGTPKRRSAEPPIGASRGPLMGSQVGAQFGSQMGSQTSSQMSSQMGSPVGSQMGPEIGSRRETISPMGPMGLSFGRSYAEEEQFSDASLEDSLVGHSRPSSQRQSLWMPTAKVRRTQSMFATPEQMLHEQLGEIYHPPSCDTSISQCVSYLDRPECAIPTFKVRQDPFPRLTHETLLKLIDGSYGNVYEDIVIVDCRFEYEYEGGHIDGAINVNTKQQLEQVLFSSDVNCGPKTKLLVFHCEYSAFRSPMMASHLRKCDREMNAHQYPHLNYPDVVVLEGGYSQFYASASHRCVPQNYVGMNTQEHQKTCEREMQRFRNGMKKKKRQLLGMSQDNNSTPMLADFKFPAPALAFKSASVADLSQKENVFGPF